MLTLLTPSHRIFFLTRYRTEYVPLLMKDRKKRMTEGMKGADWRQRKRKGRKKEERVQKKQKEESGRGEQKKRREAGNRRV